MTAFINLVRRTSRLTVALVMAAISASSLLVFAHDAGAAQITSRSLRLSSSANGNVAVGNPGEGGNGSKARHTFTFTEGTTGASVGSIEFLYCTTPLPGTTCTAPTGLDASTVTTVAGTTAGEWTIGTSTASRFRLTRAGGAGTITDTQNLAFGNGNTGTDYVKNPTTDNEDFFVRITTFSDTGFTTAVDQGTVANSTAEQIEVTAKVQETLNFSVGTTATTANITCDPLTGSALALGDGEGVLSFQQSYDAHSYFRVSTNANVGTAIYYSGDTLKYGSESIDATDAVTPEASNYGEEQFGLAINSDQGPGGGGTADQYTFNSLVAQAPYDNGDGTITDGGSATFAYDVTSLTTPKMIADSSSQPVNKTITCDTGAVRYLGNISTTTAPGVYTTTLTYIAAPTY